MLTINRIEFIKLEANSSISKLEQNILKAFEEEEPFWIDELNSCSDSLERILNSVLCRELTLTRSRRHLANLILWLFLAGIA